MLRIAKSENVGPGRKMPFLDGYYIECVGVHSLRRQAGQGVKDENKNPEFLVSPSSKLLVSARAYGRCGDFAFLHYHRDR